MNSLPSQILERCVLYFVNFLKTLTMNKVLVIVTIALLIVAGCKKEKLLTPNPIANFTLDGDTSQSLTIGTFDTYSLINNSSNAESVVWDFGNGVISRNQETAVYYTKSGNYLLTLAATNKDGKISVLSKKIRVVDRVLKQVTISSLNWKSALAASTNYPNGNKINVWVEILQGAPNQTYQYLNIGTFDAPLIYKSPVAVNVDTAAVPMVFNVSSKIVIDISVLTFGYGYKGLGYGINLYAQDAANTYLLSSTYWGGGVNYYGSIPKNNFTIHSGTMGSDLALICDYE
jgi:PKD repeat protein